MIIYIYTIIFFAILMLVMFIKKIYKERNHFFRLLIDSLQVKYDPKVFKQLLEREKKISINGFKSNLSLGAHDSKFEIIIVANLLCKPCMNFFNNLENIYVKYRKSIKFKIILIPNSDNRAEVEIHEYFFSILKKYNHEKVIFDWYKLYDSVSFKKKYIQKKIYKNEFFDSLNHNSKWLERNKLQTTPTVIIQGFILPKCYEIKDIEVILPLLLGEISAYKSF